MSDQYELVGHNFWLRGTDLALQHAFAFSISLPLASGSSWVSYYVWLEKSTASRISDLDLLGKLSVIANGAHAHRTYQTFPDASFPKDILDWDSTRATLHYSRRQGDAAVSLMLVVPTKMPRVLRFRMFEPNPAKENETVVMDGFVGSVAARRSGQQYLVQGGPWAHAPGLPFRRNPG
jgi:hypothetical protein